MRLAISSVRGFLTGRFYQFPALACGLLVVAGTASAGTICGIVTDANSHAPVDGAGIFVRTMAGVYIGLYGASDVTGAYCVDNVPDGTYLLEVRRDDYEVAWVPDVVVATATGIDIPIVPSGLLLRSPWPNPATNDVRLSWVLPAAAFVRVTAYDVLGRVVARWGNHELPGGPHELDWDLRDAAGRAIPSGTYFVRLEAGGETRTTRFSRIR